jgi:hypothetical protein
VAPDIVVSSPPTLTPEDIPARLLALAPEVRQATLHAIASIIAAVETAATLQPQQAPPPSPQ